MSWLLTNRHAFYELHFFPFRTNRSFQNVTHTHTVPLTIMPLLLLLESKNTVEQETWPLVILIREPTHTHTLTLISRNTQTAEVEQCW